MRRPEENEHILETQLSEYRHKMPLLMLMEKLSVLQQIAHTNQHYEKAQKWAFDIIKSCTKKKLNELNGEEKGRAIGLLRKAYMYRGRVDFETFLFAMEWDRAPEERFYEPRKLQLQSVVQNLQRLADGEIDTLVVSMPPRVGKTTLALLFITWLAGKYFDKSILSAGYSSSLVNSFYDGCIEFVSTPEYRFGEIFPESPLISSSAKNLTLDLASRRRYKTLTFRSIDGTVTGATEASLLLYLDDLVSGIEEAMNINRLNGLWSKVSSDMLQRKKDHVPMLVIGTRWSIHDPLGRIEAKYEDDPRAVFMRLPAIDEKGHSNFDYKYGVGFSTAHYDELHGMVDEVTWQCVYMQNPIERDGILYSHLSRFFEVPQDPPDDIFAFVDVAFGGGDYVSMPIAYQWGDDVYIVDCVFMKEAYNITEPVVAGKIKAHGIRRVVFEANNGGEFYAKDVAGMLKEDNIHCNITTQRAPNNASKMSRIIQHAPAVREWYFRDKSLYSNEEMYGIMMSQLMSFVQTGKSPHDDAPDSMAGLATMLRKGILHKPEFYNRQAVGL